MFKLFGAALILVSLGFARECPCVKIVDQKGKALAAEGHQLVRQDWTGAPVQQWVYMQVPQTNGAYRKLVNRLTGAVLEPMPKCARKAGCAIHLAPLNANQRQQWSFYLTFDGGETTIVNRLSCNAIESDADGLHLALRERDERQHWRSETVDPGPGPFADGPGPESYAPTIYTPKPPTRAERKLNCMQKEAKD